MFPQLIITTVIGFTITYCYLRSRRNPQENKVHNQAIALLKDIDTSKPSVFRTVQDLARNGHARNTLGLCELRASGSEQFDERSLKQMLERISFPKKKITIVDLRKEAHGFKEGKPYIWKSDVIPKGIITEKELVEAEEVNYINIPVLDTKTPTPEAIDQFLELVKEQKGNWFHFHCRKGGGRTGIFLILLDILQNGTYVRDIRDITNRMGALGAEDYYRKYPEGDKPAQILFKNFQRYCDENRIDNFEIPYSKWINQP